MHSKQALEELHHLRPEDIEGLGLNEAKYIEGVLTFHKTDMENIMTDFSNVTLTVDLTDLVDFDLVEKIRLNGFTRIPVTFGHNKHCVIGILLAKSLLGLDLAQKKTIK